MNVDRKMQNERVDVFQTIAAKGPNNLVLDSVLCDLQDNEAEIHRSSALQFAKLPSRVLNSS